MSGGLHGVGAYKLSKWFMRINQAGGRFGGSGYIFNGEPHEIGTYSRG